MAKKMSHEEVASSGADDRFIRFGDPDCKEGVIRGDFYRQGYHWNGSYYDPCSGADDCPLCRKGKPQMKCVFNFVVIEAGEMKPQIIELPFGLAGQLQKFVDKPGSGTVVCISRSGSSSNTRYTVKHVRELRQEEKDEIDELQLFDIEQIYAEKIQAMLAQHRR